MNQLDKDIAALRDVADTFEKKGLVTCGDDVVVAIRRTLDALEEAREVIGFYAKHPSSEEYSFPNSKARAFLAKYGEGEK